MSGQCAAVHLVITEAALRREVTPQRQGQAATVRAEELREEAGARSGLVVFTEADEGEDGRYQEHRKGCPRYHSGGISYCRDYVIS